MKQPKYALKQENKIITCRDLKVIADIVGVVPSTVKRWLDKHKGKYHTTEYSIYTDVEYIKSKRGCNDNQNLKSEG